MKLLRLLLIFIGIFSLSVCFRISYIDKEVRPSNETSVIMLTVLENWHLNGITHYNYAPVITWQKEGDKFMSNYERLEDKQGNNYYVSYPPMAFLFPYTIGYLFNINYNQVFIQILSIVLHFISAVLIYLIICNFLKVKPLQISKTGLIGFVTFTFIPVLLYTHTFYYFSELLGQFFFIIGIFLFQFLEERKESSNKKLLLLFGLNLFILIYTEWIGVFFAFTLLLIGIIKYKQSGFYKKLIVTVCFFSATSLLLTFFQYYSINGISKLIRSLSLRFLERSGIFGEYYSDQGISYSNPDSYILLFKQLHQTLIGLGYVFIILLGWWLIKNKFQLEHIFSGKTAIILILVPIVIDFVLFFNATIIHYNWWAKFGIPIAIGMALLADKLIFQNPTFRKIVLKIGFLLVFVVALIISLINFKSHVVDDSDKKDKLAKICHLIKQNSGDDESIFISIPKDFKYYNTYLSYMTKRNIVNVNDFGDANKILKEKRKVKGVFYTFEPQSDKYTIQHINLNSN